MTASIPLLIVGLIYSLLSSYFAYRESGEKWMLIHPTWIDAKCGVSSKLRWHGKVAFALLFVGVGLFLLGK